MDDIAKLTRMTLRHLKANVNWRQVVRFKRRRFVLMGTLKNGGPLCVRDPENWELPYAHVFPNGEIKRFGKVIGHREDLKIME